MTKTSDALVAGTTGGVAAEARLARDIARALSPRTILDTSGSEAFASELRAHGVYVVLYDAARGVPSATRFDLITCVPGPVRFRFDMLAEVGQFSEQALFIPPMDVNTPLVAWLTNFSAYGFAPDPDFEPGPLGSNTVLFKRGPVWPPDALRVFAGWMQVRNPAQRFDEIEAALAEQRRVTAALQQGLTDGANMLAGVEPFQPTSPETLRADTTGNTHLIQRIEALERAVTELSRAYEGVNRRVEEILLSRTWKALTTLGAIPLRILGRKA